MSALRWLGIADVKRALVWIAIVALALLIEHAALARIGGAA